MDINAEKLPNHVGLQDTEQKRGTYRTHHLGFADDRQRADGIRIFSYEQAIGLAWEWFKESNVLDDASEAKPIGINEEIACKPTGGVYTIGHALSEYVEWKRLCSAKSYTQTIVGHINYHLMPRIGHLAAESFNSEHLRIFIKDVLETPPKRGNQSIRGRLSIDNLNDEALRKRKKTINSLISIIRQALHMAWENGKYDNDRAWRVLRYLPNVDRPRTLHLSRPECAQLLDACQPDLRRFVMGALNTGCRATELLRMDASHVGRDGYGVYVTPVKAYRPRFIFLADEGMAFFLSLAEGKAPHEKLFLRDNDREWFYNYKHPFKQAVRSATLPDDFCFHGLRHTYASQLIQSGAPLPVVAEQLGHKNSGTVSKTYGHLAPQIREAEVRQRFTGICLENKRMARRQKRSLQTWRESLHGSNWRTYATIDDTDRTY